VGEHGQGDVSVPGVVAADLVVVEPDFGLGGLEAVLDGPTAPGDADEVVVGGSGGGATQVVGDLVLVLAVAGQAASRQQPALPAGRGGVGVGR
jgi:hypothetical protein